MKKPIIINFFGGAGVGKSTISSAIFALLKLHGVNCELVCEFAKDLTWDESYKVLQDQYYVSINQYHRFWRLYEKVDVIITDSPLLLGLVYGDTLETFKILTLALFNKQNNLNYLIDRTIPYTKTGRNETLKEAIKIDNKIKNMLIDFKIPYNLMLSTTFHINDVVKMILAKLNVRLDWKIVKKQHLKHGLKNIVVNWELL